MAQPVRKSRVKEVPLSEVKDDLSRFLREAGEREIVITRNVRSIRLLERVGMRMIEARSSAPGAS